MNTDVEDLLRQGMMRYTADMRAPAGMVRIVQRRRRQRLAQRSVTAVAALAACAVAVVVVALPGAHHNTPRPAPTIDAANVTKRVASALSTTGPAEIAQMTVTTNGLIGTTTAQEWSYGSQWRSIVSSSAGQPLYEQGGTSSVYTVVIFSARTWSRQSGLGGSGTPVPGPDGCGQLAGALSSLFRLGAPQIGVPAGSPPASVVKLLRTAISCGSLTVVGHQRVDGIEATELTSGPDSLISETIWVSPTTYLPVRVALRLSSGSPVSQQTADITWLQPTAQNLAKLTVPIPAGFRRVRFSEVVRPISP